MCNNCVMVRNFLMWGKYKWNWFGFLFYEYKVNIFWFILLFFYYLEN